MADDRRSQVVATTKTGNLESVGYITPIQPRYTHDCSECVFLGQWCEFDLYACNRGIKTVIARYSSEPSEYQSGWGSCLTPLVIAEALAARL